MWSASEACRSRQTGKPSAVAPTWTRFHRGADGHADELLGDAVAFQDVAAVPRRCRRRGCPSAGTRNGLAPSFLRIVGGASQDERECWRCRGCRPSARRSGRAGCVRQGRVAPGRTRRRRECRRLAAARSSDEYEPYGDRSRRTSFSGRLRFRVTRCLAKPKAAVLSHHARKEACRKPRNCRSRLPRPDCENRAILKHLDISVDNSVRRPDIGKRFSTKRTW